MKNKSLLLFICFFLFGITSSYAWKVEQKDAERVAQNFYYEVHNQYYGSISYDNIHFSDVYIQKKDGDAAFYIFSIEPKGFIIVSAEDVLTPILGYSTESNFSMENANFKSFMSTYTEQVAFARSQSLVADEKTQSAWNHLLTTQVANLTAIDGARDVSPLVLMTWDQVYPYNAMCPEDAAGTGGHALTGCVATAMSMIMYYYRYPLQGQGSHSYNNPPYGVLTANYGETFYKWDAMLNSTNGTSGNSILPVAEIMFHNGVAVDMDYGVDGSGAYSTYVPPALINYFKYSSLTQYLNKMSYTPTAWENMIQQSINEKKPLYYSGITSEGEGHAFVLDGYQITTPSNLYHFNWGWSGSDNGYFTLQDVHGFNLSQGMVKNFVPGQDYPYGCGTTTLTSTSGSFEDGSGPLSNYEDNKNCSWLIAPPDSIRYFNLNFTSMDIAAGDTVKIYDGSDANAPLLGAYSGTTLPAIITSTGDKVFVNFITNNNTGSQGFIIEYTPVYPTYCSGITTLTEPTGTINDGSDDKNYNNRSICRWKIQPLNADGITLTFNSFETADEEDFLEVYDLSNNQLLAACTGSELPAPITCASGKLYLIFKTGDYGTAAGFEAQWEIGNVGIADKSIFNNFMVYPNPTKENLNLTFTLPELQSLTVQLVSASGNVVYNQTEDNFSGYYFETIDVKNLSAGIYLLRIISDKGVVNKRVVIN
ncbi:MAG: C10 family peptidase [Lentimicrobiaceae bacterium]|nr:C10 family peptidase [Lentimicrobiaceae bacterium]